MNLDDTQNILNLVRSAPTDHAPDILKHLTGNMSSTTRRSLFGQALKPTDARYQATVNPFMQGRVPAGIGGGRGFSLQDVARAVGIEKGPQGITALTAGGQQPGKPQSLPRGYSLESTGTLLHRGNQYQLVYTPDIDAMTMEQFEKQYKSIPGIGTSSTDASFFRQLAGKSIGEQFKILRDADAKTIQAALNEQSEWDWYNSQGSKERRSFGQQGETKTEKRRKVTQRTNVLTERSALGKVNAQAPSLLGNTVLSGSLG